jgi:hypothetical protein
MAELSPADTLPDSAPVLVVVVTNRADWQCPCYVLLDIVSDL